MSHQGHLYRLSLRGRSVEGVPGVGGTTFLAHVTCSRCAKVGERRLRELMPPEHIDRKFRQAGWALDPHLCPDCRARATKEKTTMATKPSQAAIRQQAKMFTLLGQHFDPDRGTFTDGWSDDRIAKETNLAVETVTEFRREAFGELKEPDEVRQLRDDVNALSGLIKDAVAPLEQEIASLRARLATISKRWAA